MLECSSVSFCSLLFIDGQDILVTMIGIAHNFHNVTLIRNPGHAIRFVTQHILFSYSALSFNISFEVLHWYVVTITNFIIYLSCLISSFYYLLCFTYNIMCSLHITVTIK